MPTISKEYSKALFTLAAENGQIERFSESLAVIYDLVSEAPEYIEFLSSPAIPLSERLNAIESAFADNMPEYIVSFVKLLCENGHMKALGECVEEYAEFVREAHNRTNARVYSVVPLDDKQKKALEEKLEALSGKKVDAVYIQDSSLLGGLKVEMDDMTFDGSVEKHLQKVKGVIKG
ncbi:MAG: ATP synthase F1 subunit delta [Ruminococcaceae bacterium]|nr:ATP synthase F1 subunit delta [Oscillospiraceae bacterium]